MKNIEANREKEDLKEFCVNNIKFQAVPMRAVEVEVEVDHSANPEENIQSFMSRFPANQILKEKSTFNDFGYFINCYIPYPVENINSLIENIKSDSYIFPCIFESNAGTCLCGDFGKQLREACKIDKVNVSMRSLRDRIGYIEYFDCNQFGDPISIRVIRLSMFQCTECGISTFGTEDDRVEIDCPQCKKSEWKMVEQGHLSKFYIDENGIYIRDDECPTKF